MKNKQNDENPAFLDQKSTLSVKPYLLLLNIRKPVMNRIKCLLVPLSLLVLPALAADKPVDLAKAMNNKAHRALLACPADGRKAAIEALQIADESGLETEKARALYLIGMSYYIEGAFGQSYDHLKQALRIYQKNNHIPGIADAHLGISELNLGLEDYPAAKKHASLAITSYQSIKDTRNEAYARIKLGLIYLQQDSLNDAYEQFTQSKVLIGTENDPDVLAILYLGLGKYYLGSNDHNSSLTYLLKAQKESRGNYYTLAALYKSLGDVHYAKEDLDNARLYYDSAGRICRKINYKKGLVSTLTAQKRLHSELKNFRHIIAINEELIKIMGQLYTPENMKRIEKEKSNVSPGMMHASSTDYGYTFYFLLFTLVTGFGFLMMILVKYRKKLNSVQMMAHKMETEINTIKEQEHLYQELIENLKLNAIPATPAQKTENGATSSKKQKPDSKYREGISSRSSVAEKKDGRIEAIEKGWEAFKREFVQYNPNYLEALKAEFPSLTASELRLCALIKTNLSLKETAEILGVSVTTVKMARYKLRKKFGLNRSDNLVDFLYSISIKLEANKEVVIPS